MGGVAQRCFEQARDVAITCPGCGQDQATAQKRRVEELVEEVDLARLENERLQEEATKLKLLSGYRGGGAAIGLRGGVGGACITPADQRLTDEVLQLKRVLWDLQRENAGLKEQAADGEEQEPRGSRYSPGDLNALRQQVEEMQRVHDQASAQMEALKQQAIQQNLFGSPAKPPHLRPHDRLSRTDANFGQSLYASDSLVQEEAEVRRRVEQLMKDNEQLRRKVRMLAAA